MDMLSNCNLCPRQCGADRQMAAGFCGAGAMTVAATVCVHKGEEPPISGAKGICNVFFGHCNLQCCYCQNSDISSRQSDEGLMRFVGAEAIADEIARVLTQTEDIVGFVTPTHFAFAIPEIVELLHAKGLYPTTVYNTSGYETIETLQMVAPYIDIYLPDYKYSHPDIAQRYSQAADYPEVAQRALQEMFAQKGTGLPTMDSGVAFRGLIIRHLILPGQVENSIDCLRWIADNLSIGVHLALMAQYFPPEELNLPDQLNRCITPEEYRAVTDEYQRLGFYRGWVQELSASANYHPDFKRKEAFE